MTDIKQRAIDSVQNLTDYCYIHSDYMTEDAYVDGYVQGATDQDPISRADERKKCIEKACKWLRMHLPRVMTYYTDAEHTINEMLNEDLRKEFKKAMEE